MTETEWNGSICRDFGSSARIRSKSFQFLFTHQRPHVIICNSKEGSVVGTRVRANTHTHTCRVKTLTMALQTQSRQSLHSFTPRLHFTRENERVRFHCMNKRTQVDTLRLCRAPNKELSIRVNYCSNEKVRYSDWRETTERWRGEGQSQTKHVNIESKLCK